jgi:hypothetical protein
MWTHYRFCALFSTVMKATPKMIIEKSRILPLPLVFNRDGQ